MERTPPPGYYPFYLGHNYGFLAYSAAMEGRSADSLEASRKSAEALPKEIVCSMPGLDFFLSEPLLVMVRFGRWDQILEEKAPEEKYAVLRALRHHARGMAFASTKRSGEAKKELETLRGIAVPEDLLAGLNTGRLVLELAAKILEARIAEADESKDAIALWEQAVAIEDRLAYNEPADWFYPARHHLGALLLDSKRAKDAEAVYRADLAKNPGNGWSLYGLWQSLRLQKKTKEAAKAKQDFDQAWSRADLKLSRSAF